MAVATDFTLADAARLAGLSRSMVDYLCRSQALVPSLANRPGRGRRRLYSFRDIVMLRALGHLLACGISVAKLKVALTQLRSSHFLAGDAAFPGRFLITDGSSIFFDAGRGGLEDLTRRGQFVFAFVIEMERVTEEVSRQLRAG